MSSNAVVAPHSPPQGELFRRMSFRARVALKDGLTPGMWPCENGENLEQAMRQVISDIVRGGGIAGAYIAALIARSALRDTLPAERVRQLVEDCQRDEAYSRAEMTWLDPPTAGGTDELVLRAVVAITRARGPWREYPVKRVVETLTGWVTERGWPLPLDWPTSGPQLGVRLKRVKKRAVAAGVWWRRERLGGWECAQKGLGSRTHYYLFVPWGPGGYVRGLGVRPQQADEGTG